MSSLVENSLSGSSVENGSKKETGGVREAALGWRQRAEGAAIPFCFLFLEGYGSLRMCLP